MQPLPKSAELLSEIHSCLDTTEVDEFTIARLTHEAEKLMKVDAVMAYVALGRIATLKSDIKGIHENFKQAIKLVKQDAFIEQDYAASLGMMGYQIESGKILKSLFDRNLLNLKELDEAIASCFYCNLFITSYGILKQYKKKAASKTFSIDNEIIMQDTVLFMEQLNITEEMLEPLFATHFDILRKYKVIQRLGFSMGKQVYISFDQNSNEFRYEIYIDKSIDEVCEMADELAEAVAELDLPADVVYHFSPLYRVYAG
ncbi:hypothetical protein [Candidatus Albibeggiatoa sp. nov. BB20]|uniref:hypothetical protein n=1 Tax=Candidatus Albibeggiatoa sp. nov. BB20 TaxID=3162723 RepID=UPI0033655D93